MVLFGVADWYFFAVIGVFCSALGVGFWWFYTARLQIGNKAVLTKEVLGTGLPKIIAKKKFAEDATEVVVKGKKLMIDKTLPTVQDFGWTEFWFDIDGNHLTNKYITKGLYPLDADEFLADGLIRRFLAQIGKNPFGSMLIVVIGLVFLLVGLAIGVFASPYILPVKDVPETVVKLVLLFGRV